MTQLDKWFTAALVALALLAIYAVCNQSKAATQEGNWYTFASTDTLFNQQSVTRVFTIDGCQGWGYHIGGVGADSVTATIEGSLDGSNWFPLPATAGSITNEDWTSYSRVSEALNLPDPQVGITEAAVSPARFARITLTCAGDSASTTLDPDTLVNVTIGITCGGFWATPHGLYR